jgi:hypothetical protein
MGGEIVARALQRLLQMPAQKQLHLDLRPLVGFVESLSLQGKLLEHRAVVVEQQQRGRRRPEGGAKRWVSGDEPLGEGAGTGLPLKALLAIVRLMRHELLADRRRGLRREMKLQTGVDQLARIDRAQSFPITHHKYLPRLGCRRAGDVSVDRAYRREKPECLLVRGWWGGRIGGGRSTPEAVSKEAGRRGRLPP